MVKKFIDFVNEGLWNDMVKRGTTGDVRKEDGHRVKTCLGVDTIVETDCDYDSLIQELLNGRGDVLMKIDIDRVSNFNKDEQINIYKNNLNYTHMIYEGRGGTSLCVSYPTYNDICDFDLGTFSEDYSKKDYIGICKCISEKLKEVGDKIDMFSNGCSNGDYDNEYGLILATESDTWNWWCDQYDTEDEDENYMDRFKEDITDYFRELSKDDIITWSDQYGVNIGVPINYETLMQFGDWREYTQNWFKV